MIQIDTWVELLEAVGIAWGVMTGAWFTFWGIGQLRDFFEGVSSGNDIE
jgi:hypothetical protein